MATNGTVKACIDYMIKNYPDASNWSITEKSLIFYTGYPTQTKHIVKLSQILSQC